ncbi:MAG: hypothetical protein JSS20_15240 [Proteobacteria bacterium]|nr:hypothetical protein [Pseudomonadota bacterium]
MWTSALTSWVRAILTSPVLLLVTAHPGSAALPPPYDRVSQFSAVMEKAEDAAALLAPHGLIDGIDALKDGSFRIRAGGCHVPVSLLVVPHDPPIVGRVIYRAQLGAVVCN